MKIGQILKEMQDNRREVVALGMKDRLSYDERLELDRMNRKHGSLQSDLEVANNQLQARLKTYLDAAIHARKKIEELSDLLQINQAGKWEEEFDRILGFIYEATKEAYSL